MHAKETADREKLLTLSVVLATALLATGLRLYALDATALCGDELYSASRVQLGMSSIIRNTAAYDDVPPLYYLVSRSFLILMGNTDFTFRFPTALLGALSVLLTYKVGEMLWSRSVGLIGSFMLAINAYHVQFSQFARHYALTVFIVLLSLILFLKALETNRKSYWLGFAIGTAFGFYNHYFVLLMLVSETIYASCAIAQAYVTQRTSSGLAEQKRSSEQTVDPRRQALTFAGSLALIAIFCLPWVPPMLKHLSGPHVRWGGFAGSAALSIQQWPGYIHLWLSSYSGVHAPLVLLLAALFVLGLIRSQRGPALLIALSIGIPLLFSISVISDRAADPRYSVFILPLYLLVLARGSLSVASAVQRLLSRTVRHRDWLLPFTTTIVVLTVAGLGVVPLHDYYLNRPTEEWRAAAKYLADNLVPGDLILVDGVEYGGGRDSGRVLMGLSRYLPAYGLTGAPLSKVERGLWKNLLGSLEQDPGRVWAVLWYSATAPSWEGQEHPNIVDFPGVLIIRPMEPSGDIFRDTVSMLHVLLDLMPTQEGRFDVHLALADIYLRTLQLEDAQSELDSASAVRPESPEASRALTEALADFERTSSAMQDIQHPLWRNIGQEIALVGYDMGTTAASPGESLHLALWWAALRKMNRDYTAFVHVVGPDGQILVQEDRLLKHASLLTSGWRPGDAPVSDEYDLQLPADSKAGKYNVIVGVYYWETGERLPVWDELGQRAHGDAIWLEELAMIG